MKFLSSLSTSFLLSSAAAVLAGETVTHCKLNECTEHDHSKHQAPIGVMGAHTHSKGDFMVSLRTSVMQMEQNFSGDSSRSTQDVFNGGFLVSPTEMETRMQMLGLMYGLTDKVTLMAMVPYIEKDMLHSRNLSRLPGGPATFRTSTEGIGDVSIGGIVELMQDKHSSVLGGLMLRLPTGSIDEEDFIPGPGQTQLPFPMQLGSGSYALEPTVTYLGHVASFTYGAQLKGRFHLDTNDNGYKLGDSYTFTSWISKPLSEQWTASLRLTALKWENIEGRDNELAGPLSRPFTVPTTRPDLRGGYRLDVSAGLSYDPFGNGNRIALEVISPVYQKLDGPQLGLDYAVQLGTQLNF